MMEFTARISPDGKEVLLLYHDDNPLTNMGRKKVVRASNVRFDEEDQLWYVFEKLPDGSEEKWQTGFAKRTDAIQYEIDTLEAKLSNKDTNYFKELFLQEG